MVLCACPVPHVAGQMTLGFKVRDSAAHCPLTLSRTLHDRGHRGPALTPLVVRLIGKGQQHELFARWQVQVPDNRHQANAHAIALLIFSKPGLPRRASAWSKPLMMVV